jgi:Replication-relaxation
LTPAEQTMPPIGPTAVAILESINQHRLLLTRQVHALHTPGTSRRWTQYQLARLRRAGLVAGTGVAGRRLLWHLTERGAEAVASIPSRAEARCKVIAPDRAAGALHEHTIAVNDAGIAFVRAPREREDECGPFNWFHEIAHPLGPPPGRRTTEQLIADAILTYQLAEPDGRTSIAYRFIELDRATRSAADLAHRIGRYVRLYRRTVPAGGSGGEPVALWSRLYPVFPSVLIVLSGRRLKYQLEDRRRTVLALCRQDPDLAAVPDVEVSICLLDDLVERGPFAPICRMITEPRKQVNWLGEGAR